MKLNFSTDIRRGNFNQIRHHVNRTFLNKKASHQDTNLKHIDPMFTSLNISTDGVMKNTPNGFRSVLDKKNYQRRHQNRLAKIVNHKYKSYAVHHNNLKSVKRHPKRKIKNNDVFKAKLLKSAPKRYQDRDTKTNLDRFQRLIVVDFGNSQSALKMIHQIQTYYGYSFMKANYMFRGVVSRDIFSEYMENFHNINPGLLLVHGTTNVDEDAEKNKHTPSASHLHDSVIGLTYTSRHQPSFSVIRGMCSQAGIKYSRKNRIRLKNGKYVNKSAHEGLLDFKARNGKALAIIGQQVLSQDFPRVRQFRKITFQPTHQLVNGLSMNEERVRQSVLNRLSKRINNFNQQQHKDEMNHRQQARINKINGAKKSRTTRKRKRQLRYLRGRKKQIKSQSTSLTSKAQSFSSTKSSFSSSVASSASVKIDFNFSQANSSATKKINSKSTEYSMSASIHADSYDNQTDLYHSMKASSSVSKIIDSNSREANFSASQSASEELVPKFQKIHKASNSINSAKSSMSAVSKDYASMSNYVLNNQYQIKRNKKLKLKATKYKNLANKCHDLYRSRADDLKTVNQKVSISRTELHDNKITNKQLTNSIHYKRGISNKLEHMINHRREVIKSLKTEFSQKLDKVLKPYEDKINKKLKHNARHYENVEAHKLNREEIKSASSGLLNRAKSWYKRRLANKTILSSFNSARNSANDWDTIDIPEYNEAHPNNPKHIYNDSELDKMYPTAHQVKSLAKNNNETIAQFAHNWNASQSSSYASTQASLEALKPSISASQSQSKAIQAKKDASNSAQQSESMSISQSLEKSSVRANGLRVMANNKSRSSNSNHRKHIQQHMNNDRTW